MAVCAGISGKQDFAKTVPLAVEFLLVLALSAAGQPLLSCMNRSYLNRTLLMLKFLSFIRIQLFIFLGLFVLAVSACAFGQSADFYLQASSPIPAAVDPGINSSATITLGTTVGYNSAVTLTCATTASGAPVQPDPCAISPSSATPPALPSLTFNSAGLAPTQYTITVTGTSGGQTASVTVNPITVLAVSPEYSLAVQTQISPTSVQAGSGATAVLNITSTDGYSGKVTPGCSAITPLVEPSPVCSFNPSPVIVTDGTTATTTLTISTTGTMTNGTGTAARHAHSRILYALLFPLPFIVIAGLGGVGRRSRKWLSFFFLLLMTAGLIVLPACNSSNTVNNGDKTPNNTYVFTISAYDQNGVTAETNTTALTVSLTVN